MAVHHCSTVALCPLPLGPILHPLQFCFVFLTLVSAVVSSVPTATLTFACAKAMATRHADMPNGFAESWHSAAKGSY